MVYLTSQVVTEDGDEDFVGSEVSATAHEDSNLEGFSNLAPQLGNWLETWISLGVTPKNGCYNCVMDSS